MISDNLDDRTGIDEAVAGFGRIVVVDSAAAGIPARKGVPCGGICAFRYRLVELTVVNCVKGAVLVDYSC